MKPKTILKTACILLLPLLLVSSASTRTVPDADEIRAGIDASNQEFRDAFRAADVDRLTDLFTRDAKIMVPLIPIVSGRDAIREYMQYWIDFGIRDVRIVTEEVYGSGDIALEIGHTTSILADGKELARTRDMAVWKYEGGRWRVHRLLSNQ